MLEGKVFITGGAGTLGKAILKRATEEEWPCDITVFSTDTMKHGILKRQYPDVKFLVGDIRSPEILANAIMGHDIVIHGAAVKHIPVSEVNTLDTFDVNVMGSMNVFGACIAAGVEKCVAISTDKACHPHNAYGATKMLMEKMAQEYQNFQQITDFHLVRYGNVLESTGSVVEIWKKQVEAGSPIGITDPEMTRFWISPDQAVDYVLLALKEYPGVVIVPQMKSLSIGKLAEYTVGDVETFDIPLRPGEKIHETLVTDDEIRKTEEVNDYKTFSDSAYFRVWAQTAEGEFQQDSWITRAYTSEHADRMTKEELHELLGWNEPT